jgi:hypothetical protein
VSMLRASQRTAQDLVNRIAYVKPTAGKKDGRAVVVYELTVDEAEEIGRAVAASLRSPAIRKETI